VERDSSLLGYPGEISMALNADHHSVCKFESPEDASYVRVRDTLKALIAKCTHHNYLLYSTLIANAQQMHLCPRLIVLRQNSKYRTFWPLQRFQMRIIAFFVIAGLLELALGSLRTATSLTGSKKTKTIHKSCGSEAHQAVENRSLPRSSLTT
jgi:hypothetical protein